MANLYFYRVILPNRAADRRSLCSNKGFRRTVDQPCLGLYITVFLDASQNLQRQLQRHLIRESSGSFDGLRCTAQFHPNVAKQGQYVHVRSPSVLLWFKICLELEETDLGCDVGGAMRTLDRVASDDGFVHASFQPNCETSRS